MNTPVVLIIFNRPALTRRVFNEIARAKPRRLFVIADGPRTPAEAGLCEETRAIVNDVDWDCEVIMNYSDVNMGCGRRPASGISWAFEHCEEAIVLEDDCVPHPSFFPYCEELLERYRDDKRVMVISGFNHQPDIKWTPYSYYFSRLPMSWGWATWRRAWRHFDYDMKLWKELRIIPWLERLLGNTASSNYYYNIFDNTYNDRNKSVWDYQWVFAVWSQNGLAIRPHVNLITNIGFGANATHTFNQVDQFALTPTEEIRFPLSHPSGMVCLGEADQSILNQAIFQAQPNPIGRLFQRATGLIRRFISLGMKKPASSI